MTLKNFLLFVLISVSLFSCNGDKLKVSVAEIGVDTKFVNLDSIIIYTNDKSLISNHHQLENSITDIYNYQLGYCLQIGNVSDTAFVNSINQFRNDQAIAKIEKRIFQKFKDVSIQKNEIIEGLKHLKLHFPKGKIPKNVVFMNSLFQSNAFCTEKEIGIGLERYLGKEMDVIKTLPSEPFYDWIKESMNSDFLVRDAICSWVITHYVPEKEGNLAENIVKWGKILYLTEAALPNMDKNLVIRYSPNDFEWAIRNEFAVWKFLVDQKYLFKINELIESNFLKEAPFTTGLPSEGPDRLGQFIGWRMVQNYMNNNDVSLEELIHIPYNTILQEYEIED
jgi:hypothetical protein